MLKIREVQEYAALYYEAGRHDKCYKHVWQKYILPKFGINYNTFLRYMHTDLSALNETEEMIAS